MEWQGGEGTREWEGSEENGGKRKEVNGGKAQRREGDRGREEKERIGLYTLAKISAGAQCFVIPQT